MVQWKDSNHVWSRRGTYKIIESITRRHFHRLLKLTPFEFCYLLAANNDLPLQQLDMKNSFLHGKLEEEVYMEAPLDFEKYFNLN